MGYLCLLPVSQYSLTAKLKQMDPLVQCSDNRMTLTVRRIGAPDFLVDSGGFYIKNPVCGSYSVQGVNIFFCQSGEESLTPLSRMPSTCGFSVKRSRRDVQYAANYQGCHVDKQVRFI